MCSNWPATESGAKKGHVVHCDRSPQASRVRGEDGMNGGSSRTMHGRRWSTAEGMRVNEERTLWKLLAPGYMKEVEKGTQILWTNDMRATMLPTTHLPTSSRRLVLRPRCVSLCKQKVFASAQRSCFSFTRSSSAIMLTGHESKLCTSQHHGALNAKSGLNPRDIRTFLVLISSSTLVCHSETCTARCVCGSRREVSSIHVGLGS